MIEYISDKYVLFFLKRTAEALFHTEELHLTKCPALTSYDNNLCHFVLSEQNVFLPRQKFFFFFFFLFFLSELSPFSSPCSHFVGLMQAFSFVFRDPSWRTEESHPQRSRTGSESSQPGSTSGRGEKPMHLIFVFFYFSLSVFYICTLS